MMVKDPRMKNKAWLCAGPESVRGPLQLPTVYEDGVSPKCHGYTATRRVWFPPLPSVAGIRTRPLKAGRAACLAMANKTPVCKSWSLSPPFLLPALATEDVATGEHGAPERRGPGTDAPVDSLWARSKTRNQTLYFTGTGIF